MELWLDPRYVRSGYSWSFPAAASCASASARSGRRITSSSRPSSSPTTSSLPPEGYQGNWIPHQLRPAVEDSVFFVGDSAGHCLPVTAEGIRTALYFGLACGRELRAVLDGRRTREEALRRYGAFSDSHATKYRWLLRVQQAIGRLMTTPVPSAISLSLRSRRLARWGFVATSRLPRPRSSDRSRTAASARGPLPRSRPPEHRPLARARHRAREDLCDGSRGGS